MLYEIDAVSFDPAPGCGTDDDFRHSYEPVARRRFPDTPLRCQWAVGDQYFFKNSVTLSCCAALYAVQIRMLSSACARLRRVPAKRSTLGSKNALNSSADFSSQKLAPTVGKSSPSPNVDPAGILAAMAS